MRGTGHVGMCGDTSAPFVYCGLFIKVGSVNIYTAGQLHTTGAPCIICGSLINLLQPGHATQQDGKVLDHE